MKKFIAAVFVLVGLNACVSTKNTTGKPVHRLRFLGEYLLPDKLQFKGTRVGGLSGIDYDASNNLYYLISDDRSDHNPARYYTAKIFLNANGIDSVQFVNVVSLLQKSGTVFPNKNQDSLHVPDPEALRVHPPSGNLVWANEGERIVRNNYAILQDPTLTVMRKDGSVVDTFAIPANLHVNRAEKGPRRNGTLEGISFTPDYRTFFAAMEEPLYEDGHRAGLNDSLAWVRIVQFDAVRKVPLAQYAYRLDPVVKEPIPKESFRINGIPDILALNDHQLLITERSFSSGYATCNVRVYLAELNGATDESANGSFILAAPRKPATKHLLLNMDSLEGAVYNVEGATFGPLLPSGKRTLLFVADDNFSDREKSQFLLFEIE